MERSQINQKGNVMQGMLTIKSKKYLSPHYVRIVLEGEEISNFKNAQVGDNNKIAFPDSKLSGKENLRTYTLRALDLEAQEMTIDFVVHGDDGIASLWATDSKIGDRLQVFMKEKNKQLFKQADWTLLMGDHTAIPVISVILEQLPKVL